jgi:hypothetical protein
MQLAAVQFHLINTTILLLSREGFRRGCIRDQVCESGVRRLLNKLPHYHGHESHQPVPT